MLGARGDQVNPGRLNTGVAQNVRQPGHVPADTVERLGEQVPQIVGKHLSRRYSRRFTQCLHIPPDIAPVQGISRPGGKYRPGGLFLSSFT